MANFLYKFFENFETTEKISFSALFVAPIAMLHLFSLFLKSIPFEIVRYFINE